MITSLLRVTCYVPGDIFRIFFNPLKLQNFTTVCFDMGFLYSKSWTLDDLATWGFLSSNSVKSSYIIFLDDFFCHHFLSSFFLELLWIEMWASSFSFITFPSFSLAFCLFNFILWKISLTLSPDFLLFYIFCFPLFKTQKILFIFYFFFIYSILFCFMGTYTFCL